MSTGTSQLIDEWEAGGMEEEGCCCSGEGGARADRPVRPRHRHVRWRRLALFVVAGLLVLIVGLLAILVTTGLRRPCPPPPDSQIVWPTSTSAGGERNLQQLEADVPRLKNPSAMLTASQMNNKSTKYLQWESEKGHAYCKGGFTYSDGNLVVPRAGFYRVFLQITYDVPENCAHLVVRSNIFYIVDSYRKDVELLSAEDTVMCTESSPFWRKSHYTAGLFHLEANGRLWAKSSHPDYVLNAENQVFFGAELLPD